MNSRRLVNYLLLVAVVAGLCGPELVFAQGGGDEPEQDTGLIYTYRTEILFPAVVRFFVGINAPPDQIVSAALTLRQESGLDVSFTLSPEQHLFNSAELFVELVYDLDLTNGAIPVPFEPVNFLWQIQTEDGQLSTAVDQFLFQDGARGEWQSAGVPPLILHWTNENLAGRAIREEVMAAYGLINHQTGRSPLFQFAMYDPAVRLCREFEDTETGEIETVVVSRTDQTAYPCSVEAFARLYAAAGITFLQRPT
ncbi:MAG: hypothetical protein JXQ72_15145, partial [Anaerolineae bacterium]|nr:hypothetical protein [Anaerolineae bacterium]